MLHDIQNKCKLFVFLVLCYVNYTHNTDGHGLKQLYIFGYIIAILARVLDKVIRRRQNA